MSVEWALAVTTCNRKPETLTASLESIHAAGFLQPHIENDADREFGSYGCFRRALGHLLYAHPNSDAYLIFQDDIQVTPNLRPYLEKLITGNTEVWNDNTGIVSLYCAGPHHQEKSGWHKLEPCDGAHFYGALAVMLPWGAARLFHVNPPNPAAMTKTDFWLGEFCKSRTYDVWLPSPSFVRHTGDVSAIEPMWPKEHAFYRNCKVFAENTGEIAVPA